MAAVVTTLSGTRDSHDLFVGRAEQVKQLLDLLAPAATESGSGTVVSAVAGMGGIGKTALARHTATLAAGQGWFSGGVLFVDLRGYDLDDDPVQPGQVFAPMLRVLGLPGEQIPATVDEQATVYHQVLDQLADQGHRVLVVLDNASTGKQVSSLLPRHPAHRALITTRHALSLAVAHQFDLDVLAIGEAVQLLTRILARRHPADTRAAQEPDAAVRLVAVCGALPLAVEITVSILADEPTMTIATLLTELADGSGVHRVRHGERSLAAVFDLSWRRLRAREPEAAYLLPLLTLNPGPNFHTDTAAALAGHPPAQVAPWLRALRQASLLRHTNGRWSIHDVIRLHARDHLNPQQRNPATRRLLEHYLQTASAADDHLRALPGGPVPDRFTGRQDALDWFDTEHTNLTTAVPLALDTGHHNLTTGLAANLSQYLAWRRHLTDLVTVSEDALTAAQHLNTPRTLASAWTYLGLALQEVRQFEDAITAHQNAATIFQETGDHHGKGAALNNLGNALHEMRQFDDAITAHQNAATIFQETGDHHREGIALNNLGNALQEVRQFEEAITAHQNAATIFQETGDHHGKGTALNNLGIALRQVRRFEEAMTAHRQDLTICREAGDHHGEGTALNNLGNALHEMRRFDDAITAHQNAATIFQETGDHHGKGVALNNLGNALHEMRRFDDAITAHQNAATIFQETGDHHGKGKTLNNLGNALRKSGRLDEARAVWRNAVAAFQESGDTNAEEIVTSQLDTLP